MDGSLIAFRRTREAGLLGALVLIASVLLITGAMLASEEMRPVVLIAATVCIVGITVLSPNWSITIAYPLTWIFWGMTIEAIGGRPERLIVAVGLLGATVIAARSGWKRLGMTKTVGWGLALMLMMFLVAFYANPPVPDSVEILLSIVYRVVFLFLVMFHIRNEHDLKVAVAIFIGVSFVPALVTLWLSLEFGFGFIRVYEASLRAMATVDHHLLRLAASANFCTVSAVVLFAFYPWMRTPVARRWLIAGVLFLFAMATVAQLRREILITIPVLLTVLAFDKWSKVKEPARRILLASAIVVPLIIYPRFHTLQMRFHDENPRIAEGTDPRVMNFAAGFSAFVESPWVGTGPGSYAKTIAPYMGWFHASFMYKPYNVFTWAAVEAGIAAVIGLMVLLYGVWREGMKWRGSADGMCALVLGITPALITQIFIWFKFGAAWDLSLPFFLMGMILAAARITKEKSGMENSP